MVLKRTELFTAVCTIVALMPLVAAVPTDAAPRQTPVFCDEGTFIGCMNTPAVQRATENFNCEGTPQTDDVTCISVQTGEVFDCEFVGTVGGDGTDEYLCTEIEEDEPQPGQQPGQQEPAAGGGGGPIITQEVEQESESGKIDQSFKVS